MKLDRFGLMWYTKYEFSKCHTIVRLGTENGQSLRMGLNLICNGFSYLFVENLAALS